MLDGPTVVVAKSIVPVGIGDEVERIIRELRPGAELPGAHSPSIPPQ